MTEPQMAACPEYDAAGKGKCRACPCRLVHVHSSFCEPPNGYPQQRWGVRECPRCTLATEEAPHEMSLGATERAHHGSSTSQVISMTACPAAPEKPPRLSAGERITVDFINSPKAADCNCENGQCLPCTVAAIDAIKEETP